MSYTDVTNVSNLGQWIVKDANNNFFWANSHGVIKSATESEALNYILAFSLWDVKANIEVIRDKLYELKDLDQN